MSGEDTTSMATATRQRKQSHKNIHDPELLASKKLFNELLSNVYGKPQQVNYPTQPPVPLYQYPHPMYYTYPSYAQYPAYMFVPSSSFSSVNPMKPLMLVSGVQPVVYPFAYPLAQGAVFNEQIPMSVPLAPPMQPLGTTLSNVQVKSEPLPSEMPFQYDVSSGSSNTLPSEPSIESKNKVILEDDFAPCK